MAKKLGLGRGLSAILPDVEEVVESVGHQYEPSAVPADAVVEIRLGDIDPNRDQPRKKFDDEALAQLADSIRHSGVLSPILVARSGARYTIIAGERRWRAARLAGLSDVPVVVIEADDKKAMELALIENLQRADLNPIEEALGYQELMGTYEMTQEQAAARVGKSRPAVANALRLLSLSPAVLELVKDGALSAGHARALLPVKDEAQQLSIAQKVMALGLSVRQTESLCKKLAKPAQPVKEQPPQVDYLAECEKELTAGLGRKVRIVSGKRKGRIELEYYGQDDLQQLYDALHTIRKKEHH